MSEMTKTNCSLEWRASLSQNFKNRKVFGARIDFAEPTDLENEVQIDFFFSAHFPL